MCGFLKVSLLQLFYDMDTLLRFVDNKEFYFLNVVSSYSSGIVVDSIVFLFAPCG